jgi:hypothetical protein
MDIKKEIETIKTYLDLTAKHGGPKSIAYQTLKLKYEALTMVPTTIEKTMTPAQLYASDSPLWAYNYTEEELRNILEVLENKAKTEENFNIALNIIHNRNAMFDEFGNLRSLGGVHGNLLQVGLGQEHKPQKIQQ